MWCMFVVGHDCGHTTFSPSSAVNEIMGEVSHSVLLCTPFAPWRRSHHRQPTDKSGLPAPSVSTSPLALTTSARTEVALSYGGES